VMRSKAASSRPPLFRLAAVTGAADKPVVSGLGSMRYEVGGRNPVLCSVPDSLRGSRVGAPSGNGKQDRRVFVLRYKGSL
jgi:hypothetical protein